MCNCFTIGETIGADPDCPVHGTEAVAERERQEATIEALRSALGRTLVNFKALLESRPVRDADETIAEAESALNL